MWNGYPAPSTHPFSPACIEPRPLLMLQFPASSAGDPLLVNEVEGSSSEGLLYPTTQNKALLEESPFHSPAFLLHLAAGELVVNTPAEAIL